MADHGTHVAGIIAARKDAKIGPGVYPFSEIYSYEIDLASATAFAASVAALLDQVYRDRPKVVNMSDGYSKTLKMASDPFELQIINGPGPFRKQALVIAAAGNSGSSFSGDPDCPVKPACYSRKYRNVMSVIALDDDPAKPSRQLRRWKRIEFWGAVRRRSAGNEGAKHHIIEPYSGDGWNFASNANISDIDYDVLTLGKEKNFIKGKIVAKEKYQIIAMEIGTNKTLKFNLGGHQAHGKKL